MPRAVIPEAIELTARTEVLVINRKTGMCFPYHGRADAPGVLTIGQGHVIRLPEEKWMLKGITRKQALDIFAQDVASHSQYIQKDIGDDVKLNDWVYGALASFCFNLGERILSLGGAYGKPPTVTLLLREGEVNQAMLSIYAFSNADGEYVDGLFYRRLTEIMLALGHKLVDKPSQCQQAYALIKQLSKFGSVDAMTTYFQKHHVKRLCLWCSKQP